MKVTIKTLKGELFNVDAEPAETIQDLKGKIKNLKGFDVDSQKLVFKGKNTVNTETLEGLGVKEGDFMVVMVTVKKPEAPAKPETKPIVQPQQPTAETKPVAPPVPTVAPTTSSTSAPSTGGVESHLVVGEEYENTVQSLMGMGFTREQVIEAMRAAFNNPERAVEYLCNGIPSHPVPPPSATGGSAPGANTGNLDPSLLAGLINSPQFAQIRQAIRNDPSSLPVFLQQIAQASPPLFNLISQNPELFEQLIMQEGGESPQQPPPGTIAVTPAEKQAIERLAALGFSKMDALQAYLACDKNEELAANLLFDRMANGDLDAGEESAGHEEEQGDPDDDNLFS